MFRYDGLSPNRLPPGQVRDLRGDDVTVPVHLRAVPHAAPAQPARLLLHDRTDRLHHGAADPRARKFTDTI